MQRDVTSVGVVGLGAVTRLVEVVRTDDTADEAVGTVDALPAPGPDDTVPTRRSERRLTAGHLGRPTGHCVRTST